MLTLVNEVSKASSDMARELENYGHASKGYTRTLSSRLGCKKSILQVAFRMDSRWTA
jgi:hypothetical protein